MDRISNLPDNLVVLILERLNVIDMVNTSILSRSWRLKWTLVSSLILDDEFYGSAPSLYTDKPWKYANVISSLLLQHGGCLKKFSLYIPPRCGMSLFHHSIVHVTRNKSLQELILDGEDLHGFNLSSSIFSVVNLTSLELSFLDFCPPSWFEGFPNLTRFVSSNLATTVDSLNQFVSVCPKLEKLALEFVYFKNEYFHPHTDQDSHSDSHQDSHSDSHSDSDQDSDSNSDEIFEPKFTLLTPSLTHLKLIGHFIYVSISSVENLESVCIASNRASEVDASIPFGIFELFRKALQLKYISLFGTDCKFLGSSTVIKELPQFDQLKNLRFCGVNLSDPHQLRCFLSFCPRSPNARNLYISSSTMGNWRYQEVDPCELETMAEKINCDLTKLVRLDLFRISCMDIEKKIIKLLLRFSPALEVMYMNFHEDVTENTKLQFVDVVTNFYQASTKIKFQFTSGYDTRSVETGGDDKYFPYIL